MSRWSPWATILISSPKTSPWKQNDYDRVHACPPERLENKWFRYRFFCRTITLSIKSRLYTAHGLSDPHHVPALLSFNGLDDDECRYRWRRWWSIRKRMIVHTKENRNKVCFLFAFISCTWLLYSYDRNVSLKCVIFRRCFRLKHTSNTTTQRRP